jgi:hypothetical protein
MGCGRCRRGRCAGCLAARLFCFAVVGARFMAPAWREIRRQGAAPALKLEGVYEAEAGVEWLALGGGVQRDGLDAALLQVGEGVGQECPTDALAAVLDVHQDHADPGDALPVAGDGGGANDLTVIRHGNPAAGRVPGEQAAPIVVGLVPAGLLAEALGGWDVGVSERADAGHQRRRPIRGGSGERVAAVGEAASGRRRAISGGRRRRTTSRWGRRAGCRGRRWPGLASGRRPRRGYGRAGARRCLRA